MLHELTLITRSKTARITNCLLTLTLFVSCIGCRPRDAIQRYQVARPEPPHRMLGAIVPHGEREWFFKVTGANEAVAKQADQFRSFIESVRFGEEEQADPTWQLPDGWTEEPGGDMRFATIKIATSEAPLELTVIPLPAQGSDSLLANVNRWRGQLGLSPVDIAGLADETSTVPLASGTATLVNLVGSSGASVPMSFPSETGASDADAARLAHAAAGVDVDAAPPPSITYEAPPEWKPGQRVVSRSAFAVPREAAFVVNEEDRTAEITVTALGASAGAIGPNVNRWRGQIGLEPLPDEQIAEQAKKIDMNGVEGEYFRLIGPQRAILGVIATHGGKSWFVKLDGDHDLAVKLQDQFEAFARSIKF